MKTPEQTRNMLVAVDVQNDFISGSLVVNEGAEVVDPINEVAAATRHTNGTVAFTRDWHPATTPHFDAWPVHCVADTEGAAFSPALTIAPTDTIISKGMGQTDGYSGVEGVSDSSATLESLATPTSSQETVRIFIGGLATDYCVKATALDLAEQFQHNERVSLYLLRDAVRAVNLQPDDGDDAIKAMEQAKILAISSESAQKMILEELS